MPLISDNDQVNKLKKLNINIKTKYIVNHDILERNTDNHHNDDIKEGIRCKKEYYLNNKLIHTESKFDSRISYTYLFSQEGEKKITCPNCGMNSKLEDFLNGCPYCRTHYNIDYTDKKIGNKEHYDRVLRSSIYRIITFIIDLLISFFICYLFIKNTSRTFNSYDISKIFIYSFILSLILFYFFYVIDAYLILAPIRLYKDYQNKKQIDFWERTKINKKNFFNNLNYEIQNYYYNTPNIIDYDILDYDNFSEYYKDKTMYVKVKAYVRVVYYQNNKFVAKYLNDTYLLRHLDTQTINLKEGANLIKCPHCGSSIDVTKGRCEYCNTKINYFQEWIMDQK